VWVGTHTVIRFRSPAGSLSAPQHAQVAAARLKKVVEAGTIGGIEAGQTDEGRWGLFVDDTLVAIADPNTATLNDSTQHGLAQVWARNLTGALGMPPEVTQPSRRALATTCTRVVDGDTIIIEGGERVRYIGIDAPETKHPRKPVEYFGREAAEFNRELVEGKRIRVEFDVAARDKYGRLLGYVYLNPQSPADTEAKEVFVNAELVRAGYAKAYTVPPNVRHTEHFLKLDREARQNRRGLWEHGASDRGE